MTLLDRIAPSFVTARLRRARRALEASPAYIRLRELGRWKTALAGIQPYEASGPPRRVLIVPSDPWSFQGAKGDEAMMEAAIGQIRARWPNAELAALTATPAASVCAESRGFRAIPAWRSRFSYSRIAAALAGFRPDITLVLGADVLDGYYSPVFSARLLLVADLSARLGADVSILGFSFNNAPAAGLAQIFPLLHDNVRLNLRDAVSCKRFARFTGTRPNLSADIAFLLRPDGEAAKVKQLQDWIADRRMAGRRVIGFNIHPMLFREATKTKIESIVAASAKALTAVHAARKVAFLLISHDSRNRLGDDTCLSPLLQRLRDLADDYVRFCPAMLSAAQIKAVAGSLDGVVTARMHLAVAALAEGVPVAAVTYQDKFHGLFAQFGIGPAYRLSPAGLLEGKLEAMMLRFIDDLPPLRETVAANLPAVLDRAATNLDGIIPERTGK